ncbi:hypothetical protein [Niveispirillum sp. KHB5.9]|uniref:hypothetical protein n=1 Tax=Niveispirillum sp. KHB5.9 TaxID=3400269 RepID=UPI003A8BF661
MAKDLLGNSVTVPEGALSAINDFVGGMIAYEARALNILEAAEAPDAPALVHVYAGFLNLLAEATGAAEAARPHLAAARLRLACANEREVRLANALSAWIDDDIEATVAILSAILADHPRDLTTLKLLHYHQFNHGDFPAMLRAAQIVEATDPHLPYLGGCLAFAYEQLHLLDAAAAAARAGLALVPTDPWAQHALAHVWLTQGRIGEGLAALTAWSPGWQGLNSFMVTHLWWHLALLHLGRGDADRVLEVYDTQVWAHARDYSQDQVGAVSLLARLELAGYGVGDRWAGLAAYLAARAGDVVQPFLSVQYAYGLARAGRAEADGLLAAIARAAENGPPHSRATWHDAALPLARGLVALARGDAEAALPLLSDAVPRLARLGGSHAQRDLFAQFLLDAQIKAGAWIEAQQALELRRATDPGNVPLNRALAALYRRLDLPQLAEQAEMRAVA